MKRGADRRRLFTPSGLGRGGKEGRERRKKKEGMALSMNELGQNLATGGRRERKKE